MSSSGVNVLRYTALALGAFYGFSHQRTITSTQKAAAEHKQYEHKQKLIDQAKAAYAKSKAPAPSSLAATATGGLNQDVSSASFDLDSYFDALAKANP